MAFTPSDTRCEPAERPPRPIDGHTSSAGRHLVGIKPEDSALRIDVSKHNHDLTLRLPFAMVDQHHRLEQILLANSERSWADNRVLLSAMALSGPERRFAHRLLKRKRNLWLYRCNQKQFCGDFVVIEMSASRAELRTVWVIELKACQRLSIGGRPGIQMRRARKAVDWIAGTSRVIPRGRPFTTVRGDYQDVLDWLIGGPNTK